MIESFPIHTITDILSLFLAYRYYEYLKKKDGDHVLSNKRLFILIGAAAGALIGSRLLSALSDWQSFINPPTLLYYYAGKTIVGALLGGIIGVEITKKVVKERTKTGDLFTLPLILGMAIGRVGCFLSGVKDGTVGNPSNLPWAMDQGDGILRHPTSLYEIIFLIILFFVIKRLAKNKNLKSGYLFRIFTVSYLLFRFLIEFIKPGEFIVLGLTFIQVFSLVFAIYYLVELYLFYRPIHNKKL